MNQIPVLHADHGQCASTTTVRAAGSSGRTYSPASPPGWRRCGADAWRSK
nr:Citrate synthase [Klebsiella pneumoniae]